MPVRKFRLISCLKEVCVSQVANNGVKWAVIC